MTTAAILVIGNEILSGQVQDLHVHYMAPKFMNKGINLKEVRIVPVDFDTVVNAIVTLSKQYDFLFTTGGIGPTHDDITKSCIAKALNVEMAPSESAKTILEKYWLDGEDHMVVMPKGANLVFDPTTKAFSFYMDRVYVLPGVPLFLRPLFDLMIETLPQENPLYIRSHRFYICEEKIAQILREAQNQNSDIFIGSYPFYEDPKGTTIVLKGKDQDRLDLLMGSLEKHINVLKDSLNP
jgi:molybdenum cofactor synthesis domain-containing protein